MNRDDAVYRTDVRPHLRTNDELVQTVSRLQATLESTADGILVVDTADRIVDYNEQFRRIWGFPDEILPPRGAAPRVTSDAAALDFALKLLVSPTTFIERVQELYANPAATSVDVLQFLDGRVIERYSQPQMIDGQPVGRVWSFRDVTHLALAERTLQRHNRILEHIAQGVPQAEVLAEIAVAFEEQVPGTLCTIMLFDEAAQCLRLGTAPSLPESYHRAVMVLPVGPQVGSCGAAAYERGTVITTDIDEDPRWQDWRIVAREHGLRSCLSVPIFAHADVTEPLVRRTLLGTFAVYRHEPAVPSAAEISQLAEMAHLAAVAIQRHHDVQQTRESEERYRLVAELSSTFCYQAVVTPDHLVKFRWISTAAPDIAGYAPEELEGLGWTRLIHPDDIPVVQQMTARLLHSPELGQTAVEARVVTRSGEIRWIRSAIHLVRPFQPGQPLVLFGAVSDITERKLAEQELSHRQAELLHAARLSTVGQMVAAISHEIAQPLTAISNLAVAGRELLETAPGETETTHEYVNLIVQQAERCRLILQRLRDYSRRQPAHRSTCDLNSILRDSVGLIANELRRQAIDIELDLAPGELVLLVDRILWQQVVVNLLTNARDALADRPLEHRRIIVRSGRDAAAAIWFEVEDFGTGLGHLDAGRLFTPFQSTKSHGMGIGLSICRTIVGDSGGKISGCTNAHGGATFRVEIPDTLAVTGGNHG